MIHKRFGEGEGKPGHRTDVKGHLIHPNIPFPGPYPYTRGTRKKGWPNIYSLHHSVTVFGHDTYRRVASLGLLGLD